MGVFSPFHPLGGIKLLPSICIKTLSLQSPHALHSFLPGPQHTLYLVTYVPVSPFPWEQGLGPIHPLIVSTELVPANIHGQRAQYNGGGRQFHPQGPRWSSRNTVLFDSPFASVLLRMCCPPGSRQAVSLLTEDGSTIKGTNFVSLPLSHDYDIICSVGMFRPLSIVFSFQGEGEKPFSLALSIFVNLCFFRLMTFSILGDVSPFLCFGSPFWTWVSQASLRPPPPPPHPKHCAGLFKCFLLFISCLGLF